MTIIAQITDLHIRPRGLTCNRVSETNEFAERTVRAIKALDPLPDAVVITGDLTDGGDPREYRLVRRLLEDLPCPVYVMPGNCDTAAAMREHLSSLPNVAQGSSEKLHYSAMIGDIKLIVLDSSVPGHDHGELGEAQLLWLDDELLKDRRPTLIALHHPPKPLGIRQMDAIGLVDGDALADVVSNHSNIGGVVCGHGHRAIVTAFAGTILSMAPSTAHQFVLNLKDDAPLELVMEPPAYFLHLFTPESGFVTHLTYVENFPGPFPLVVDEEVDLSGS